MAAPRGEILFGSARTGRDAADMLAIDDQRHAADQVREVGDRRRHLGCGFGRHCQYAIEHGASSVTGVDISEKMLKIA